jgi:serine/threonine protein kinase
MTNEQVNVLISQNGQALLSDFGFAKFLEEVRSD